MKNFRVPGIGTFSIPDHWKPEDTLRFWNTFKTGDPPPGYAPGSDPSGWPDGPEKQGYMAKEKRPGRRFGFQSGEAPLSPGERLGREPFYTPPEEKLQVQGTDLFPPGPVIRRPDPAVSPERSIIKEALRGQYDRVLGEPRYEGRQTPLQAFKGHWATQTREDPGADRDLEARKALAKRSLTEVKSGFEPFIGPVSRSRAILPSIVRSAGEAAKAFWGTVPAPEEMLFKVAIEAAMTGGLVRMGRKVLSVGKGVFPKGTSVFRGSLGKGGERHQKRLTKAMKEYNRRFPGDMDSPVNPITAAYLRGAPGGVLRIPSKVAGWLALGITAHQAHEFAGQVGLVDKGEFSKYMAVAALGIPHAGLKAVQKIAKSLENQPGTRAAFARTKMTELVKVARASWQRLGPKAVVRNGREIPHWKIILEEIDELGYGDVIPSGAMKNLGLVLANIEKQAQRLADPNSATLIQTIKGLREKLLPTGGGGRAAPYISGRQLSDNVLQIDDALKSYAGGGKPGIFGDSQVTSIKDAIYKDLFNMSKPSRTGKVRGISHKVRQALHLKRSEDARNHFASILDDSIKQGEGIKNLEILHTETVISRLRATLNKQSDKYNPDFVEAIGEKKLRSIISFFESQNELMEKLALTGAGSLQLMARMAGVGGAIGMWVGHPIGLAALGGLVGATQALKIPRMLTDTLMSPTGRKFMMKMMQFSGGMLTERAILSAAILSRIGVELPTKTVEQIVTGWLGGSDKLITRAVENINEDLGYVTGQDKTIKAERIIAAKNAAKERMKQIYADLRSGRPTGERFQGREVEGIPDARIYPEGPPLGREIPSRQPSPADARAEALRQERTARRLTPGAADAATSNVLRHLDPEKLREYAEWARRRGRPRRLPGR